MLHQLPDALAAQIDRLLSYDPRTAGGLMTTHYFSLADTCTVSDALQQLRRAGQAETVFYVYVVDSEHRLAGVVSLRQLVMADPESRLRDLMESEVIRVSLDEPQEDIARLITRFDFLALPVVDGQGRMMGIVTVDDIIDVIGEEATEDILRLAGVHPDEMLDSSSRRTIRHRLPWLFVSWLGGLLASYIINAYEVTLQNLVVLAAFFPRHHRHGRQRGHAIAGRGRARLGHWRYRPAPLPARLVAGRPRRVIVGGDLWRAARSGGVHLAGHPDAGAGGGLGDLRLDDGRRRAGRFAAAGLCSYRH